MPGHDRPDSLKRALHYLSGRLREARATAQAGLIERAMTLIKAGFLFEEWELDKAFEGVPSNGSRWVSHELVMSLATMLRCDPKERIVLLGVVFPTYVFGRHVRQLREEKNWSRSRMVRELIGLVQSGTIGGEVIGEGWLQQIDEGRRPHVPKLVVKLLADVLGCDELDRFKLLLEAGYGLMDSAPEDVGEEVDPLEFTAYLIRNHPRGGALLKKTYINDPETFFEMTAREVLTVFESCLALLKANDESEK